MGDLYEGDILLWSEEQAALLRRLAAGERVNDQVDWENVVEEIESVGRNELHAVESLLVQALVHILKAQAWPMARDRPHWEAEARGQRAAARRRFAPRMRHEIDLAELYRDAIAQLPESYDALPPAQQPPADCPVTLDDLLGSEPVLRGSR